MGRKGEGRGGGGGEASLKDEICVFSAFYCIVSYSQSDNGMWFFPRYTVVRRLQYRWYWTNGLEL